MQSRTLALAGLLLASSPAEAREKWWEARSPHFVLVTNATEAKARSLLENAERFRDALARTLPQLGLLTRGPVAVYAFRDEESFEPFLPEGGDAKISGYFRKTDSRNAIVIDASAPGYERVLFHEYVHLVLGLREHRFPLWFEEGLSEFYAGTGLDGDGAEVGRANSRHLRLLSSVELLPMEEMLRAEEGASALFYAESWALVHYLLLKAPEGQARLSRFLSRTGEGEDPLAAFLHVFGEEPREMDERLAGYVKEGIFESIRVPLGSSDPERDIGARLLSTAQVQHRWGELFFALGRPKEARMCLEEAVALDAELAPALETLGFLSLSVQEPEAALGYFRRASLLSGASASGLYEQARLLLKGYAGPWVDAIPDAIAEEAVAALRRSLGLEPGAVEAAELLAFVYVVRGERLDDAESLVATAMAVAPRPSLLFLQAQLFARRGSYARAREILSRVLREAEEPKLREAAARFLARMSDVERAPGK